MGFAHGRLSTQDRHWIMDFTIEAKSVGCYIRPRISLRHTGDNIGNKLRFAFLKIGCPRGGREGRKGNNFPRLVGRQAGGGRGSGVVTFGRPLKQRLLIYFTRIVNSIGPLADDRSLADEPARVPFITARDRSAAKK